MGGGVAELAGGACQGELRGEPHSRRSPDRLNLTDCAGRVCQGAVKHLDGQIALALSVGQGGVDRVDRSGNPQGLIQVMDGEVHDKAT